ncbi:hypothetical protein VMCG_05173 [Cytospora schulzeri]|uniref:Uncharacterized protein n=1 Tax=Cytospora schulzeri TaxID=448051 RepID=A0A423WQK4_9PEZI|nr:hypothetical protein VMCG_05173 [Valsa malicola]
MASPSQVDNSTESGDSPEPENDQAVPDKNDEDVHISGAPAVVTWIDEQNQQMKQLCHTTHDHVMLHVHRETFSNTAFFQLRANVALKAKRDKTHILLSICPERIRSINVSDGHEHQASAKLGTSTYGLEFKLSRPPALIVPKGDLTPKQKTSRHVLDSFRTLAEQTSFDVHLATTTLGRDRLLSLCEATSSGRLQSMPRFSDVTSLYGGKGGNVIENAPVTAVTTEPPAIHTRAQTGSPPSYDELGLEPGPSRPSFHQSKDHVSVDQGSLDLPSFAVPRNKRRRASSGSEHLATSSSYKCMSTDVRAICSKMLERIDYGFSELNTRMGRMEQRLTDLETSVKCHTDKWECIIERVNQNSSEQVDELRDELETGLYDVRKETEDIITARVDDEMYAAQQELRDHVRDEMADVEERVGKRLQESLSNASLSLDINWNE